MTKNTDTLIAKPIIKDKFWVVTDGEKKVGNIEADGTQYRVVIGDSESTYTSTSKITRTTQVRFDNSYKIRTIPTKPYAVWPTNARKTFNNMIDIVRKLHVFTKSLKSRCYYAAGWFVRQDEHNTWQTELCPKYIFLKRYKYYGPFHTEAEALELINTLQQENTHDSN